MCVSVSGEHRSCVCVVLVKLTFESRLERFHPSGSHIWHQVSSVTLLIKGTVINIL